MGFSKTTYMGSLLFILGFIACGWVLQGSIFVKNEGLRPNSLGFGGPSSIGKADFVVGGLGYAISDDNFRAPFIENGGGVLYATLTPLTNLIPTREGFTKYKVRKGDTISGLAAQFGITADTIRFANPNIRTALRVGEELIILPVSGILYEVRDGDDISSVASRFNITIQSIQDHNPNYQKLFETLGNLVILPNVKPGRGEYVNQYVKGLPDLKSYFTLPARGWNWGELHDYNAIDIAGDCGESIYASAEGLVIEESRGGAWNNGYGNYILIEHPNGTKTRYAHTEENLVRVGDVVTQGKVIAKVGNTGNTHGPTGCHLHFEVQGAKNPFAIRSL